MQKSVLVACFQQLTEQQIAAIKARHGEDVVIKQMTPASHRHINFFKILSEFKRGSYSELVVVNILPSMRVIYGHPTPYGESCSEKTNLRVVNSSYNSNDCLTEEFYDLYTSRV